jgi:phage terminase large subunit-like protein
VSSPDLSRAQQVALLPEPQRNEILDPLNASELAFDWSFWARPSQYIDPDDLSWYLALFLAGRGTGKTRSGNEWVRGKVRAMPGSRGAFVARTAADVRDVLVDGDSGIMNISPPSETPLWEPSKRRLTWPNGATATAFSSEVPDALRGPQFDWALGDEVATWETTPDASGLTALDNLRIATRLGANPQIFLMTTPKRTQIIKRLLAEIADHPDTTILRRGRTSDNLGNLSQAYLNTVVALYEGTALATQELDGQMLDDVEGALWSSEEIDEYRLGSLPPIEELLRPFVIVSVDPSVAENPRDECGIVVLIGTGHRRYADRHIYVMEDRSLLAPPSEWAKVVAQTARKWGAVVVAEYNQGAGLIRNALENIDPSIRVHPVHSRVGKALRAEPVQLATDQGRVHMVGFHTALEDQLTTWQPERSKKSPDRLDAMVQGALAIITDESKAVAQQAMRISSDPDRRAAYAQLATNRNRVTARDARGQQLSTLPPHMRASLRGFGLS